MRRVAAVAVLGVAALAVRRHLAMRNALAAVPTELRNSILPFVPGMYHGADALAPKAGSMQDFRRGMLDHLRTHLQAA